METEGILIQSTVSGSLRLLDVSSRCSGCCCFHVRGYKNRQIMQICFYFYVVKKKEKEKEKQSHKLYLALGSVRSVLKLCRKWQLLFILTHSWPFIPLAFLLLCLLLLLLFFLSFSSSRAGKRQEGRDEKRGIRAGDGREHMQRGKRD